MTKVRMRVSIANTRCTSHKLKMFFQNAEQDCESTRPLELLLDKHVHHVLFVFHFNRLIST